MARRVFSRRLQQLRIKKGVNQKQMSKDLGMTQNYIFNIENDYAYPTMTIFFAICEYLDITPKDFFDWEL